MTVKELEHYKMTDDELEKWIEVRQIILDYCKILKIPAFMEKRIDSILQIRITYEHIAGYCKTNGYFYITYGDRGELYLSCQSKEKDDICFYIIKEIAREAGTKIEMQEREQEAKKWMYYIDSQKTRPGHIEWVKNTNYLYHTKHDTRKKWFEYVLNALLKVFKAEKVASLVEEYTGYMNHWFDEPHWAFDRKKREFVEISYSEQKK